MIYPWSEEAFREAVVQGLHDDGFNLHPWREEPDDSHLLKVVDRILESLLQNKWVLFCGQNARQLQSIAEVVPITFALTTGKPVSSYTTKRMLELLPMSDDDMFGDKRAYAAMWNRRLLVWQRVNVAVKWGKQQEDSFYDILERRMNRGWPLLLTAMQQTGTQKPLFDEISDALGAHVSLFLQGEVEVITDVKRPDRESGDDFMVEV